MVKKVYVFIYLFYIFKIYLQKLIKIIKYIIVFYYAKIKIV